MKVSYSSVNTGAASSTGVSTINIVVAGDPNAKTYSCGAGSYSTDGAKITVTYKSITPYPRFGYWIHGTLESNGDCETIDSTNGQTALPGAFDTVSIAF